MNFKVILIGLFLSITSFSFAYPVQVVSSTGNVLTVSLFASFLKLNIQPEFLAWGMFIFSLWILVTGLTKNKTKEEKKK